MKKIFEGKNDAMRNQFIIIMHFQYSKKYKYVSTKQRTEQSTVKYVLFILHACFQTSQDTVVKQN